MSVTRVASRYAKSLLDLAIDQSQLTDVVADVKGLQTALTSKDLTMLIQSPTIKSDKKAEIFTTLFQGKVQPLTMAFLTQTIKKRRDVALPQILLDFDRQHNELLKVTNVKVTVAHDADTTLMSKIKAKLEQSGVATENVNIEKIVDPSLIGGYIIEFGDRLVDASVAYQLNKIKQSFTN